MPNWVTNKVVLTGSNDRVKEVIDFVKGEDSAFDFNKIVPMPESLNITSPPTRELEVYLAAVNPENTHFAIEGFEKLSKAEYRKILDLCNKKSIFMKYTGAYDSKKFDSYKKFTPLDHLAKVGNIAVENVVNYSAFDWYDWRCDNWGTKWNTSNDSMQQIDDNTFVFETAWATPIEVLKKLSVQFPDIRIDVHYADEDIGNNCGFYYIKNGEGKIGEFKNCIEAVSFAKELWGIEESNAQTIEPQSVDQMIKHAESKSNEQLVNSDFTNSLSPGVDR